MTNRKTATKLLLVQWARFQKLCVHLEGSTLFTGVNGSGKSTILDAMTYLLAGNTQFNKAAKDRDRTVLGYVRGDTRSNGSDRYLRSGEVVSYIAMEFWSPVENEYLVAGVCMESTNETTYKSSWFICRDARIEQINFTRQEGKFLRITPRGELTVKGQAIRSAEFLGKDRGVEQTLRALGLRCNAVKYRSKLVKMMAFNPENNIDQFIQECVLEPGEVASLKELREQRQRFEQLRGVYQNLKSSKAKLEEVEKRIEDYESKQKKYSIRELMLSYQELKGKEEERQKMELQVKTLEQNLLLLEERKKDLDKRCADAENRYRIAINNDIFRGMQETLRELERQKEKLEDGLAQNETELAKVKRLQIQVADSLRWLEEFLTVPQDEKTMLKNLAEDGFPTEAKLQAFVRFAEMAGRQKTLFAEEKVHSGDRIRELNRKLTELVRKIKRLQANILVFPREIEEARRIAQAKLDADGIRAQVRIFAELVQEVRDPEWRAAIEAFLGWKRFYFIVDGQYCHRLMQIIQKEKLYAAHVVISDKLPDTAEAEGSAAAMLTIPNADARRYANYLLNGIHLCESLEELHEHPLGGLMKDGMLARGYTVSCMELEKTEFCLGQDAVRLQLESAVAQKTEITEELEAVLRKKEQMEEYLGALDDIDWKADSYSFGAAAARNDLLERQARILGDIEAIRQNPDFMAVLQEQEKAGEELQALKGMRDLSIGDIRACEQNITYGKDGLETLAGETYRLQQEYEELRGKHLELEKQMLEEYERLKAKREDGPVITPKTVRSLKGEVEEAIRQMESAQLEYCRLAEIDINRRGTPYIPFFREEYRNIANIRIEEAASRLEEQSARLESAFMNDFVAEINETIREAREEINAINRELKQLPFGNDTYKFVMKEKPDRQIFFRICRKLERYYMDRPEAYMNSGREDEEMERDIREFMGIILDEEDETEYTDYRKYFVYDMEIVSRQGDSQVVADLSKKQGSASNGEKQTPYFIILAASLLQCYPRQNCCARLAFIDEAFSALSRERIEQMVKYLSENHFQVFYAAPPEKISSIGAHIESTVSLVMTGRYTNAVEGLVKENAETV